MLLPAPATGVLGFEPLPPSDMLHRSSNALALFGVAADEEEVEVDTGRMGGGEVVMAGCMGEVAIEAGRPPIAMPMPPLMLPLGWWPIACGCMPTPIPMAAC